MSKYVTKEYVISKLKEWSSDEFGIPNLLVSQNDGAFHLGYYAGMGNSDNTPIEKLEPIYKEVIVRLYQSGVLQSSGKAFTLYPGSDSFKKVLFQED